MTMNYEPELMYALDSLDEYSDWKNVYNVSGDDVCYCPICLGKVKLWNGQDPNKTYKKQRCFHHIDGMCTQERYIGGKTRINFSISSLKNNINNLKDYIIKILEEELINMLNNMKNSKYYCRVMEVR